MAATAEVRTPVDVVCGVIWDGPRYLLASRPEGRIWAGYWEFPGGKVEPGEDPADAMVRELREELGITAERPTPWIRRTFDYPHARVNLHFFHVRRWHGALRPLEGQSVAWQTPGSETVTPLLPANEPVLRALRLPAVIAITPDPAVPHELALEQVARGLAAAKWPWLMVRRGAEPTPSQWDDWQRLAARAGATAVLNASLQTAQRLDVRAWHASSAQLCALRERPRFEWVGASVHSAAELIEACQLGLDYAILGPVKKTSTHPEVPALGWDGWQRIAAWPQIPVFAIGGLDAAELAIAAEHGAQGVAMISGAWR